MEGPLAGCYLKLERGKKHMERLDSLAVGWLKEHPIALDTKIDAETGEKFWYVASDVAHPPEWWGLIFGEFLYALRSCLDHLAWQLVIRAGNEPDEVTEFPIFKDASKFESRGPRKMGGMSPAMVEAIKGYQPCFTPNPAAFPLWWLQELCNIDKHRILHVIVASSIGGGWYPPRGMDAASLKPHLGRLEHNTEVLRVPPEDVSMDYQAFLDLELDIPAPSHRRNLRYLLQAIYSEPLRIAERFRTEFFEASSSHTESPPRG